MAVPNIHPSSVIGLHVEIAPSAYIGPNCFIDGHTRIGANTRLIGGTTLLGDIEISENCLIEPGVTISITGEENHPPRPVTIGSGTRLGAGSVLERGVKIGANARVTVGSFVCRDVPPHAVVSGNPAAIIGYDAVPAKARGQAFTGENKGAKILEDRSSSVRGIRFYTFPMISDPRGDLTVAEFGADFPFEPKRYFVVFNVPVSANRGEHAHWKCAEILICLQGSVIVVADDGVNREEIELTSPDVGLYIAPMVWRVQYRYSADCILLVLASSHYEPDDYIRDYESFLVHRRESNDSVS